MIEDFRACKYLGVASDSAAPFLLSEENVESQKFPHTTSTRFTCCRRSNELLRFTMLADSCLMGPLGFGITGRESNKYLYRLSSKTDAIYQWANETRDSAAYSSQSTKKRHMQAGDYCPSPDNSVPECVRDCHNRFVKDYAGIPTVPGPTLSDENPFGEGSWGYA